MERAPAAPSGFSSTVPSRSTMVSAPMTRSGVTSPSRIALAATCVADLAASYIRSPSQTAKEERRVYKGEQAAYLDRLVGGSQTCIVGRIGEQRLRSSRRCYVEVLCGLVSGGCCHRHAGSVRTQGTHGTPLATHLV